LATKNQLVILKGKTKKRDEEKDRRDLVHWAGICPYIWCEAGASVRGCILKKIFFWTDT
jgi:hypothetical protein